VLPNETMTVPRTVVLLQEQSGAGRVLCIWIGVFESEALLMLHVNADVPRPLTFTFASNLLQASGGRLQEVRISRLTEETFFAETVIQASDGSRRVVDSRPSDAMCLALAAHAPIRVAESLMRQIGETPDGLQRPPLTDGTHVLGMREILDDMRRRRERREAEMQAQLAELRARRAAGDQPV
jgi:bifunctional DNase/RNase